MCIAAVVPSWYLYENAQTLSGKQGRRCTIPGACVVAELDETYGLFLEDLEVVSPNRGDDGDQEP